MASSDGVTLSELIESTAAELHKVQPRMDDPVMEFTGCELELAVTLKKEGKGGIRFYVVSAEASVAAEMVSRVTVTFRAPQGRRALALPGTISDEAPPLPDPGRVVDAGERARMRGKH